MATPEEQAILDQEAKEIDDAFRRTMAEQATGDVENTPPVKTSITEPSDQQSTQVTTEATVDSQTVEGTGAEPKDTDNVEERVEVFEGFTAAELKEQLSQIPQLKKAIETTNGTYGAQLQQLNALVAELRKPPVKTEIPKDDKSKEDDLIELKEEYGEVAEKLHPGVKRMIENSTPDTEALKAALKAEIQQDLDAKLQADRTGRNTAEALKELTAAHPDWQEVAKIIPTTSGVVKFSDPKFGFWVSQQPEDVQDQIVSSNDVTFLAGQITKYKESGGKDTKKTTKPNLEKAITPATANTQNGQAFESEDDIIQKAYEETMRKLASGF